MQFVRDGTAKSAERLWHMYTVAMHFHTKWNIHLNFLYPWKNLLILCFVFISLFFPSSTICCINCEWWIFIYNERVNFVHLRWLAHFHTISLHMHTFCVYTKSALYLWPRAVYLCVCVFLIDNRTFYLRNKDYVYLSTYLNQMNWFNFSGCSVIYFYDLVF